MSNHKNLLGGSMLTLLHATFFETFLENLKNNLPLAIILAVVGVLIIVLAIVLIVNVAKGKKAQKAAKTSEPEAAPAEPAAPAQPVEEKPAEPVKPVEPVQETHAAPVVEVPAEPVKPAAPVEEKPAAPVEEKPAAPAPVIISQQAEPQKKVEPKVVIIAKKADKKAAPKKAEPPKISTVNGKWVIENVQGKYWLSLVAPNGQVMVQSPTSYASLSSAKSGIKTYQENIAAGHMEVTELKNGDSQVQILNGSGRLLATSSTYSSKAQTENALSSIKRWAPTKAIVVVGE